MERGRVEGEALGIVKGEGKSLMRLLERRFGTLPEAARERIANANIEQLDRWLDRVFDAENLGAVLGD